MHHLSLRSRRHPLVSKGFAGCQTLVRFFALHRIKPHTPPLVRAPVNSFEFHTCVRTPQAEHLTRWLRHRGGRFPRHLVFIVYGQDYRGIQSLSLPWLSSMSVSYGPAERLRHWCSSRYLRISPLHREFPLPLPHSSLVVSTAEMELSSTL